MAVISISRQYGSGGDEIAERICEILSYRRFDKQMIAQAAVDAGLSEQEIIDYSEDSHKVRNFLDRLLNRQPVAMQGKVWREEPGGVRVSVDTVITGDIALTLVQKAIRSAYQAGNVVIVGRGGQVLLREDPGVLHIRVEAPMEDRIQRVREQLRATRVIYTADIEPRRQAQDLILARDAASADYIHHFYNEDWTNPMLYHAIINTGRLSLEQAAQCIAHMAKVF